MAGSRVLVGFLLLLAASPAASAETGCPEGNLLAGRRPLEGAVLKPERLTDGVMALEGLDWRTEAAAVATDAPFLTFDLAALTRVSAMVIQGDHQGTHRVLSSRDGRRWQELWITSAATLPGLSTRMTRSLAASARFVRIENPRQEGAFAISEVAIFCTPPEDWPPLARADAARDHDLLMPREIYRLGLASHKLALGLLGLTAFLALWWTRRGRPPPSLLAVSATAATFLLTSPIVLWFALHRAVRLEGVLEAAAVVIAGASTGLLFWSVSRGEGGERGRRGEGARVLFSLNAALAGGYALVVTLLYAPDAFVRPFSLALFVVTPAVALAASRRSRPAEGRPHLMALACLLVAGVVSLTHFGTFFQWRTIIEGWDSGARRSTAYEWREIVFHDQFHYYLGSKYARELGYDLLYECVAVAETENGRGAWVARARVRDLRSNELRPGHEVVADQARCRERFDAARWREFRRDVDYFRTRVSTEAADRYLTDHGYNATPVWTMLGRWITAGTTAHDETLGRLAALDAALYLGIAALLAWAFGIETCALALFAWGLSGFWVFTHVGAFGSFGRFLWLFAAVAGVSLLKREMPLAGGAALAAAGLLRVFPALLFTGQAIRFAFELVIRQRVPHGLTRQGLGALLGAVVLVTASLAAVDGLDAYRGFVANSTKHASTPLSNYMGLPTIVAWRSQDRLARTVLPDDVEPARQWRARRTATLEARSAVRWTAAGALLALAALAAVRSPPDWRLAVIGILPVFALLELTNYYYALLILLAPLALERLIHLQLFLLLPLAGLAVFVLTAGRGTDLTYTLDSWLVLGVLVVFAVDCVRRRAHSAADQRAARLRPVSRPICSYRSSD